MVLEMIASEFRHWGAVRSHLRALFVDNLERTRFVERKIEPKGRRSDVMHQPNADCGVTSLVNYIGDHWKEDSSIRRWIQDHQGVSWIWNSCSEAVANFLVLHSFLDTKDATSLEYKLDSFSSVYRRLTGKEVSARRRLFV